MIAAFMELWQFLHRTGTVDEVADAFLDVAERREVNVQWETFVQGADEVAPDPGWQPFAVHTEPRDPDSGTVYVMMHYRRRVPK